MSTQTPTQPSPTGDPIPPTNPPPEPCAYPVPETSMAVPDQVQELSEAQVDDL